MAQEQIDFKVDIPESWALVTYSAEENLWAYESNDKSHRLTVSIHYYSQEPDHYQQGQFLDDFLKIRQEEASKIANDIKFTKIEIKDYKSAWVAKFNESSSTNRLATNKSISTKIGIANFYLESFSNSINHEKTSSKILSTTGFAS
jgi:hypothetical protein